MAPFVQIIHPGHSLQRFYAFHKKMSYYGALARSVEMHFWNIMLNQHGRPELSAELLSKDTLQWSPQYIHPWVDSKGIQMSTAFQLAAPDIYRDIVVELLRSDETFRANFQEYVSAADDPTELKFLVTSSAKEFVYSTGTRCSKMRGEDPHFGLNLYGHMLEDLAIQLKSDELEPSSWPDGALLSDFGYFNSGCEKSTLVLMDSYGKYCHKVENGEVVSVGGGRYWEAYCELKDRDLSKYQIIIVHFGANNTQKKTEIERLFGWDKLLKLLEEEGCSRERSEIILSLPITIPGPRFKHLESDARRMKNDVSRTKASTKIKVLSWFDWPFSPFLPEGATELEPCFFEGRTAAERFHLNHDGFRLLWKTWCTLIPDLKAVKFNLERFGKTVPKRRLDGTYVTQPVKSSNGVGYDKNGPCSSKDLDDNFEFSRRRKFR